MLHVAHLYYVSVFNIVIVYEHIKEIFGTARILAEASFWNQQLKRLKVASKE